MIPGNFHEWMSCIEEMCKIDLTPSFAQKRLDVYQDNEHPETQKFIHLYGDEHLKNIINWYKKIIENAK